MTLPQSELSKAAASLPNVCRRQGVYPRLTVSSQGIGRKTANPLCIQQLAGEERAAGRQTLPATLPDACDVRGGKYQISQLPWKGLLLRISLPWEMGKHTENTVMLSVFFLWVKIISSVTTYVWIIKSDLTSYLDPYQGVSDTSFWTLW